MIITILRLYFKMLLRLYYKEIKVSGIEFIQPEKPQLLVSNHQNSLVDGLMYITQVESEVILTTTSTVRNIPLMDWIMRKANVQIFYRRVDGHSEQVLSNNRSSLERCADLLAKGNKILVFPEGLTTTDGKMLPFKTGFARIAKIYLDKYGANLEIIPMYINYENRSKVRSSVTIDILKPIKFDQVANQREDFVGELTRNTREILEMEASKRSPSSYLSTKSRNFLDRVFSLPFIIFHLFPSAVVIALGDFVTRTKETHATTRVFVAVVLFPIIYFLQIIFLISILPFIWVFFLIS